MGRIKVGVVWYILPCLGPVRRSFAQTGVRGEGEMELFSK